MTTLATDTVHSDLAGALPCRELQIRTLATLISPRGAPCRNVVLYGLEATGKTVVSQALLETLSQSHAQAHDGFGYAIVKSDECISGRHLLEQTAEAVARGVAAERTSAPIVNISELVVELQRLFEGWVVGRISTRRFVLVFDAIDKQRDAPPTLLPALARIGEIVLDLTIIFVTTCPRPAFLHLPGVPHLHFPSYTKAELLTIIALTPPVPALSTEAETTETWARFTTAVYDSLTKHSGRDIVSFRAVCLRLWPQFVQPVLAGEIDAAPFSRLMVAHRGLFQNDVALVHNIIANPAAASAIPVPRHVPIARLLSTYARILLVAAYLASFNSGRNDVLLFVKSAAPKRRKKGGATALTTARPGVSKSRKTPRKLLGAQVFTLERLLAIFHAIRVEATPSHSRETASRRKIAVAGSADVQMGVATLISMRLLLRVGSINTGDMLEAGNKYRVAVDLEVARGVARTVGIEMDDYLAE